MAINDINPANPVQPAVLPSQTRDSVQPAPAPLANTNPPPVVAAAVQALTPAQEAELLINETLRNLSFEPSTPTEELLTTQTNPLLTSLDATQGLEPPNRLKS
jgi:hypothetical protein